MGFVDRVDAGRRLAERLEHLRGESVVVLGMPRGGVLVAFEVARALGAPLDVLVVRKLCVPFHPELIMGAVGEGEVRVIDQETVALANVSEAELAAVEDREHDELERQAYRFRGHRPRVTIGGRTAVVVDDGVATGATAEAACRLARAQGADRVVLAVPVAPADWTERLGEVADELVSIETPDQLAAIGRHYDHFGQVPDEEVVACLERATLIPEGGIPSDLTRSNDVEIDLRRRDGDVQVPAGSIHLAGHLTLPTDPRGVVVFAHGSGSSRHSPRNGYVADVLNHAGFATLLFDLLTRDEEDERTNLFDIELLGRRLIDTTEWVRSQDELADLPLGYFGAHTGAAAALWAAAETGAGAVVSRGGRPDLAAAQLVRLEAPTLLIVGGQDDVVLDLNRIAVSQMRCEARLEVVPGATHLWQEPGALRNAAELARSWFVGHLAPATERARR